MPVRGPNRRAFIAALGGAAAWPVVGRGEQVTTTNISRIGWLATGSPTSYRFSLAAFRDGMKALNYIEGQNFSIEYRWGEGNIALLPELAKDLVHDRVDVILAGGSLGAEAAKKATSVIPIVAAGAPDLVELGLVTSLARPGGNLTGFVVNAPETAAKRVQIIKEIKPDAKRVAAIWNSAGSNARLESREVKNFAAANDITIALHDAHTADELKNALAEIIQSAPDFILVLNDPLMFTERKITIEAADHFRLPAIYGFREFVDDGGLISYGSSLRDTYRDAASYVDKILKGAKPSDLPVQLPTKYELVINLKTAKALGLTIPPTLLARADEVIE
jgi:putative ABC transport system substrate-binding protein